MNYELKTTVIALALCVTMPLSALAQDKKKKEKTTKEKKEWVWEMPEKLSGNDVVDKYLLTCDSLNTQVRQFADSIVYYKVAKKEVGTDENGLPVYEYQVVDNNNVIRSKSLAFSQYVQIGKAGSQLVLAITKLGTRTASATAALPKLGLNALSYGKYVKAGPKLISAATSELKGIMSNCADQRKQIRALKKGMTESGALKDPKADPSNIEGVDFTAVPVIEKTPEQYAKEVAEAKKEEAKYSSTVDWDDTEVDLDS